MSYMSFFVLTISILLQGCVNDSLKKTPYSYQNLPGWSSGDQISSINALKESCEAISKQSNEGKYDREWLQTCKTLLVFNPKTDNVARKFIEKYFTPYSLSLKGASSEQSLSYFNSP